ncbi:MAG TPA: YoaK family protein [Streptosporangiaceae bacterium]|jgi:uncharacterized membrane protein YoaK (UPF0700 family)
MERDKALTPIAISLTFCSGAMDVASFTRLGGVFTSVMTGNIVLCGLSIARGSVSLLLHTIATFSGYVVGVALGTRMVHGDASGISPKVRRALSVELVLLCGLAAGWWISGALPVGWVEFCLLATGAAAMGVQSATVQQMGLTQVSTTFLTGTLTGLVGSLVKPNRSREGLLRPGVLLGLLAGALLSGLLVSQLAMAVPVLFVGAIVVVLVLSMRAA